MSRLRDFALPDLGEGLTEGEILTWHVRPGDEVALNQVIVEVETAKAAVEVPSPFAGVVVEIHHQAGETVDVGSPIISFDTDPSAGPLEGAGAAVQSAQGAAANPVESAAPKHASATGTVLLVAAAVGPAVVAGHVDSATGVAVFTRLGELAPGDEVEVGLSDGTLVRYVVTGSERYPKDAFPSAEVYGPAPASLLRLITCGGTFDRAAGSYRDNLVVYAVPAT